MFGRGTICRFSNNALGMKHLADRDFEDLLQVTIVQYWSYRELTLTKQCAIPVFELLLPPEWNEPLLDLLFELAMWQGLVKLQMHMDTTLSSLDTSTTRLGRFLWHFIKETEKEFETRDLPSEEAAHGC